MKTKLWQSADAPTLHPLVESYTVGNDLKFDQKLLGYDITASQAHAKMLGNAGIIPKEDAEKLVEILSELLDKWKDGKYQIPAEYEDGHSAIEGYLTEKLGQIGKKIHTGRSRNDQILVTMRLYLLDSLEITAGKLTKVVRSFKTAAEQASDTPIPGYTHTQKAMPTTVATFFSSFADAYADQILYLDATKRILDQNPLGSSAGFGNSLPLNREETTKTLGFAKTQENPMYCGLSRGLFELMAVQALTPLMTLAGKFASDLLFFTTQELAYFSLPANMTTGSSIMPHKRNYDVYEIVRAKSHAFTGYIIQLQAISAGVGSGYHRDLQLTKSITMQAFEDALSTLEILTLTTKNITLNQKTLAAAMTDDLRTVEKINALVTGGMPFRDAYMQVKNGQAWS